MQLQTCLQTIDANIQNYCARQQPNKAQVDGAQVARERKKCDQNAKPKMKKLAALVKKYGILDRDAPELGLYNLENR